MSKRAVQLKTVGKRKLAVGRKQHSGAEKSAFHGRSESTRRILKMYQDKGHLKTTPDDPSGAVRIEPSRKWFGNTRVTTHAELHSFRETLAETKHDPMSVLLKRTKIPMSLLGQDGPGAQPKHGRKLDFAAAFKDDQSHKTSNIEFESLNELVSHAQSAAETYETAAEQDRDSETLRKQQADGPVASPDTIMSKGTSKRIWGELYKVIDSSDILLQVLDVRDPLGTRCYFLEKFVAKEKPFKHVVLVLNKCDLVPKWVTLRWVSLLSKEYPTVAFRSSLHRPFGKKSLIGLLRQFADGLKNRKNVTMGLVGYPNVGKSSVINTLRGKKVCNVAPIPGETKVWQYVDLTKRLYLLDCPGVVKEVGEGDADVARVVKGVVRAEKLADPCQYIDAIIKLVGAEKFLQHYKLPAALASYADALKVLEALAQKLGLLGKGGEPLSAQAAVRVIFDLQRAKLPYFCAPPAESAEDVAAALQARQLQEIARAAEA